MVEDHDRGARRRVPTISRGARGLWARAPTRPVRAEGQSPSLDDGILNARLEAERAPVRMRHPHAWPLTPEEASGVSSALTIGRQPVGFGALASGAGIGPDGKPETESRIQRPGVRPIGGFRYVESMGHLLGYARVSTSDQDPQLQLDALTAAGCFRVWVDHASGARAQRPELAGVLDHLREGDTLVVWRLDRLGRSLRNLLDVVTDLEQRGVGLRSLTESIDTTTASGRLVFAVFGAMAEFERDLIRERTAAGLAAARARGRTGGRPSKMTPDKLAAARHLLETTDATMREVAATVGVSRTTLYRHLAGAN